MSMATYLRPDKEERGEMDPPLLVHTGQMCWACLKKQPNGQPEKFTADADLQRCGACKHAWYCSKVRCPQPACHLTCPLAVWRGCLESVRQREGCTPTGGWRG
jgi:hypothetical protein